MGQTGQGTAKGAGNLELHQSLLFFQDAGVRGRAGLSMSRQHPEGQPAPGHAPSQHLAPAVGVLKERRKP